VLAKTGPEPAADLSEYGTMPEPVPDVGEAGSEPSLVFEGNMDDSFDKVADFDKDEGLETLIVIVQPKTIKIPQTGER